MNHVISVSLNGREYRLEKSAHAEMDRYLEDAKRRLKDDPDAEEIIADLERSFAEKCDKTLQQYRNVITEGDVKEMLQSVGIVESLTDQSALTQEVETPAKNSSNSKSSAPTRRKKAVAAAAVLASLFLASAGAWAYVDGNNKNKVPAEPKTTEVGPGSDTAATVLTDTPTTPSPTDQAGAGDATTIDPSGQTGTSPAPTGSGVDPNAATADGAASGEASTYPECPANSACDPSVTSGAPADAASSPIAGGSSPNNKK